MKQNVFSIPIYKYEVLNWNVKKTKLLELFSNLDNRIIGNVITSPINIKTDILSDEVKLFEKEVGMTFFSMEVWFQRYEKNMNHSVHTHGAFGFSSICFIEYDDKYHHPTTFISPFSNYITGELERYQPKVKEGDIIFFPSNLLHYAPVNLSDKKRTIMSFNLMMKNDDNNIKMSYN